MQRIRFLRSTGDLGVHGHLHRPCCLLFPRLNTQSITRRHHPGHGRTNRPDCGGIQVAAGDDTAAAYQALAELFGGVEQQPEEEQLVQLPSDMGAVLGHMLADASVIACSQQKFCINCGRPLIAKQPCACGYIRPTNATDALIDPDIVNKWKQLQIAQQLEQQQQSQKEPPPKGLPVSIPARSTRTHRRSVSRDLPPVSLVFHEHMLDHRASLPPFGERPERLAAILTRLLATGVAERCQLLTAKEASDHEIYAVHNWSLLQALEEASEAARTGTVPCEVDTTAQQQATDMEARVVASQEERHVPTDSVDRLPADADTAEETGTASSPVNGTGPIAMHDREASPAAGSSSDSDVEAGTGFNAGLDGSEEEWEEGTDEEGSEQGTGIISADTLVSPGTYQAARLAAGASCQLVRQLMTGQAAAGMALIRPPGHHAQQGVAQGGCFFNNAAIAATAAQDAGAERVLILDWDVHHGQGTQAMFEDDPSVLYISMHRADEDFYPFSGAIDTVGKGEGEGYTINIPWKDADVGDADYLQAMVHIVLPVCYQYQPDLVIISAGFGAAAGDPLGHCHVTPAGFAHMTHLLKGVAPVAMLLEGGYNLDVTARCAEACVRVLLGERPPTMQDGWEATKTGVLGIMNAMQITSQYWSAVHPWSLNGWMGKIREEQAAASQAKRQAFAQQFMAPGAALAGTGGSVQGNGRPSVLYAGDDDFEDDDDVWVAADDEQDSGVGVLSDLELLQAMLELDSKHRAPSPGPSVRPRATEEVMPVQRASSPGARSAGGR